MSTTLQILRQLDRTLAVISWYGSPTPESIIEDGIETAVKELVTPLHAGNKSFDSHAPPVIGYLYTYMRDYSIDNVNTNHMINAATNVIKYIVQSGRSVDQTKCPTGSDLSYIKPMKFMPLMYTKVDTMFTTVMGAIQNARQMPTEKEREPLDLVKITTTLLNMLNTELGGVHIKSIDPSWLEGLNTIVQKSHV
jgi:hypothetical protein